MSQAAYVIGVGLTKFVKPGGERDYPEMAYEAGLKALLDAQINYDDVETGIACYCFGDSTCGQRVFYQFGMTTIPIYNTNNACATGSTGLHMARTLVRSGVIDCAMVVGFEKMQRGSIRSAWADRSSPLQRSKQLMDETRGKNNAPPNQQYFGNAGKEYIEMYGATDDDLAEIARVSHLHSSKNPYAQFRSVYSLQEVKDSPMIYPPLTKLQCSPTSDGASAAVIVSQRFLDVRPHLKSQAVLIAGQSLLTDSTRLFSGSSMDLVGFDTTAKAARVAMEEAGVSPKDITVCEMHDCFSANELITIDGLGLCEPGKAHEMVRSGDITYGGSCVINPSGGLISKGHPLGATGLAQCAELVWQLRGWANNRLVENTSVALQHNLGLGGAVVVNVYKRADGAKNKSISNAEVAKASWAGYNPAVEARGVTAAQADRVRSKKHRNEWALSDTSGTLSPRL